MTAIWSGLRQLALVVGLVSTPVTAAGAADAGRFDVMGIRLNMTSEEVTKIASANGFDRVKRSAAPSFDQAVAIENRQQVGAGEYAGTHTLRLENDREKVQVSFVQTSTGSRVNKVYYTFFGSGVSIEQMSEQVVAKYGDPDQRGERDWVWGDTSLRFGRIEPFLEYSLEPASATSVRPIGTLTLADPSMQKESKEAIRTAAAERASGKKPTF